MIFQVIPNSKLTKKPILKDKGYELHCSVKMVAVSMDSFKEKILEKLEHLPKNGQQEVLDFVEFLEWRKENRQESQLFVVSEESDAGWLETGLSNLGSYEPYNWQLGELDKGLPVKYIEGALIIQPEGSKKWETVVHDLREERINK